MATIDAERAFDLMYELLKAHPWLNKGGTMTSSDAIAEQEAIAFLAAGDLSRQWGDCGAAARRVVNSLLIDFMVKLRDPESPISRSSWEIDTDQPEWRQALCVISAEISMSHPHMKVKH
ncbi:hypothetical protein [Marinobacter sp. MCTG268]|uniref:hypothetical protein n=1 Tax=Marinobacter adhaerens TaxID=1033846 RepID=UPI0005686AAB